MTIAGCAQEVFSEEAALCIRAPKLLVLDPVVRRSRVDEHSSQEVSAVLV